MSNNSVPQKVNDHLANERTFLAWIRTSLGIMGFGFVVVKFSLFIRQIELILKKDVVVGSQHEYSGVVGVSIVVIGALTVIVAFFKYRKTNKQIEEENFVQTSNSITIVAVLIFVIGLILSWYLIDGL
ncbi:MULTISPECIES: YidH family protein [unclassified Sphingobacterium]|uniref:YidH family protein n=1 Tax=unclassified Sphingobacterium TaxID=2609468 RepID=UPI001AE5B561|nr:MULTISPECIES: DUF202 domain-containing protein [unclassified Sphingobacterium]MDR6735319.1 putative membrane protein [Sphingobacterium sp. 2149]